MSCDNNTQLILAIAMDKVASRPFPSSNRWTKECLTARVAKIFRTRRKRVRAGVCANTITSVWILPRPSPRQKRGRPKK